MRNPGLLWAWIQIFRTGSKNWHLIVLLNRGISMRSSKSGHGSTTCIWGLTRTLEVTINGSTSASPMTRARVTLTSENYDLTFATLRNLLRSTTRGCAFASPSKARATSGTEQVKTSHMVNPKQWDAATSKTPPANAFSVACHSHTHWARMSETTFSLHTVSLTVFQSWLASWSSFTCSALNATVWKKL